jgi:hypothetical protein
MRFSVPAPVKRCLPVTVGYNDQPGQVDAAWFNNGALPLIELELQGRIYSTRLLVE